MTLWLVGMMGSGKTSAGRLAADQVGADFHDTDDVVAARMGCSIAQVWGSIGESAFRDLETVATMTLAGKHAIVATGGGVVLADRNRHLMRESGEAVWLKASPAVLARRLVGTTDRPILSEGVDESTLGRHLSARAHLYHSVADHEIETDDMSVSQVAAIIGSIWGA